MVGTSTTAPRPPISSQGPFAPPSAAQRAHQEAVHQTRQRVGHELEKRYPNYKLVFKEMGQLSRDEAADFARRLRLEHPDLHAKLIKEAHADADTRATLFADEPALSKKIVEQEAKALVKAVRNVEPNRVVELMNRVPARERAEVLRQIERTDPGELRWLRQVCRDSNDPALRQAFKDFGR